MHCVREQIVDNFVRFSFGDSPNACTNEVYNYACALVCFSWHTETQLRKEMVNVF